MLSSPNSMARPSLSPKRCWHGCRFPSPDDRDGRLSHRLGCGVRGPSSLWGLDGGGPDLAHKLPRAESGLPGPPAFSPLSHGTPCHCQDRQHGGGVLCESSRDSRSRTLDGHARHLLLWAQGKFRSHRAVHVPGALNLAADFLSRQKLRSGDWVLNPLVVAQIWERFGRVEVDLFATKESSQCPLWFSLRPPAPLGVDALAHPWPRLRLYAFPPIKLIPAVQLVSFPIQRDVFICF